MNANSVNHNTVVRFGTSQLLIAIACLFIFLVLGLVTGHQMRPWVDEAWYGAPGLTLANHGYFGSPSYDGSAFNLKDIERYSYWVMPVFPLAQTAWDLVFPQTLHSIRVISTLSGIVAIICWTMFFFHLTRSQVATTIFLLLASCDYVLTSAAGFGRPDMMAFMFQAAAFGSYMFFRERNFELAILFSQTCVVLSGLTHPNGGILSFLGVLFISLYFDYPRIRLRSFLWAAVPYVAGGIGWGLYILQDPSAFFAQYGAQTEGRFTGFAHPWKAISREITVRYAHQMGFSANFQPFKALTFTLEFLAILGTLLDSELRRQRATKVLLGLVGIFLVFYVFLEQTKQDYYFAYLSTIYAGILASYLGWLWQQQRRLRPVVAIVAFTVMAVQAAGPFAKLRRNPWGDYAATAQWLSAHALPSDQIIGSYELGFFLGFTPRFRDDYRFGLASGKTPDFILMETIYNGRLEEERARSEKKYLALLDQLSRYKEVYRRGEYRVLARNDRSIVD